MDNMEDLQMASLAADDMVDAFHEAFDLIAESIIDKARDALLEGPCTVTRETLVAQIIMEEMFANPCDPENKSGTEALTTDNKKSLVEMADHMGPDWAQALYHAAVFITKVA